MNTVVYLANQQVQVVLGTPGDKKINIEKCYIAEAPEGSIINGMVMDSDAFVQFLKDFWAENKIPDKDVYLVINSSKFVAKNIEMPVLNDKKTFDYIAREFSDMNEGDDYLYSILPMGNVGKMKKIYAERIEPDFLGEYIEIFEAAGIKVKSISSGESSLIGLASVTTGSVYKNFALVIADSSILTTILWINGTFNYLSSMRCFHDRETEDYAGDVARAISQTVQFMQAHQIEEKLDAVVIAGIDAKNLSMYRSAMEQMSIFTAVQIFEARNLTSDYSVDLQKCLRAASGLVNNGKWMNFLKQYNVPGEKQDTGSTKFGINLRPIIWTFIGIVALIAIAGALRLRMYLKLKTLTDYNESGEIMMSVSEYDMLNSRNQYLEAQSKAISDVDECIASYPVCNSKIQNQIKSCAKNYVDVEFDSFDAEAGTVEINAYAESVDQINYFIKKLNQEDIFKTVDYTGYTYSESSGVWDIHVTCTLAESAGRGE